MRIVSVLENQDIEKRIAITPEIAKKYVSLGIEVTLSKNYGAHLGIQDKNYFCLALNFGFVLLITYTLPLLLTSLELRSLFFIDFNELFIFIIFNI